MFLVTTGSSNVSVPDGHQDMTATNPEWPDLRFGVEDLETILSRTTNGLSLQCTHALNRH